MKKFQKLIQAQFEKMCATGQLFRVELTHLFDIYLQAFEGDDVFRDPESSVHNCNLCHNFMRRYGNIVAVDSDYNLMTLFDVEAEDEYNKVAKTLSKAIKESQINGVFFESFNSLNLLNYEKCKKTNSIFRLGLAQNLKRYTKEEAEKFGVVKPNEIVEFNHFYLDVPSQFVLTSDSSIESVMGEFKSSKDVFKRGIQELSLSTLELVRDLIQQGSLLDGQTHLYKVEAMIKLFKEVEGKGLNENWFWVKSYNFPLAKFKNELIGVLCSEIQEGKNLNEACLAWNKRVDPANYMKASAPITKQQIASAQKFVEENGYVESFDRRLANIDDIKASEILHLNSGSMKKVSIFDSVKSTTSSKQPDFKNVEEISIDKFMSDILPNCTSVEAYFVNKHINNLVSLTTSNVSDSKPIFKWSNNYSWTFKGNLAGKSLIKEAVKTKGGAVDGDLRFSIMWAEGNSSDNSDLDAHCVEPGGIEIYFGSYTKSHGKFSPSGGQLDIDITDPGWHKHWNIVENITYSNMAKMRDGKYRMYVRNFCDRHSQGFQAEIEFDGQIYSYEYKQPVLKDIVVAEVTLKSGQFTIQHILPESNVSKEAYGISTNEFHKVNLLCLSPNHWDNNQVGNKFYFFMLEGCKTNSSIRSFHSENLIPELAEHRKVLEVLGSTTMVEPTDNQLSGLGFNATIKDELIVKVEGTFKRMLKIKF